MDYYINVFLLSRGAIFTDAYKELEDAVDDLRTGYKDTDRYIHTIKVNGEKPEIINLEKIDVA